MFANIYEEMNDNLRMQRLENDRRMNKKVK